MARSDVVKRKGHSLAPITRSQKRAKQWPSAGRAKGHSTQRQTRASETYQGFCHSFGDRKPTQVNGAKEGNPLAVNADVGLALSPVGSRDLQDVILASFLSVLLSPTLASFPAELPLVGTRWPPADIPTTPSQGGECVSLQWFQPKSCFWFSGWAGAGLGSAAHGEGQGSPGSRGEQVQ